MKRQLNGGNAGHRRKSRGKDPSHDLTQDAPVAKCTRSASRTADAGGWTPEEDLVLQQHAASADGKSVSWPAVCRAINKRFKHVRRTSKQCQERMRVILSQADLEEWTVNEELILLCLLHIHRSEWAEHAAEFISKRSRKGMEEHVGTQVRETIERIKDTREKGEKAAKGKSTPIEKLQTYVLLSVFLRQFVGGATEWPAIAEQLRADGVAESDCLEYLKKISSDTAPPAATREALNEYVEDVMEKVQNRMLELAAGNKEEDDGLEELFHQRPDDGHAPQQAIHFQILSPNMTGREQYLISIYFLP